MVLVVLTPHTDFHLYRALGLFRKVNVLIYLNDNWGPADGGRLELFRKGESEPDGAIVPSRGRVVYSGQTMKASTASQSRCTWQVAQVDRVYLQHPRIGRVCW